MNIHEIVIEANKVINNFPKNKNGEAFITLKDGKKVHFNKFVKKYGLNGDYKSFTGYGKSDLARRLVCVEFFDYFVKEFDLTPARVDSKLILHSIFHKMVIVKKSAPHGAIKYELISFYPLN